MAIIRLAIGITMACAGLMLLGAEETDETTIFNEVSCLALGWSLILGGYQLSKDTIDKYHL